MAKIIKKNWFILFWVVGVVLLLAGVFYIASRPYPAQAGALLTYPKFRAWDSDGNPLSSGKLYSYQPGTTSAKATYSNKACTTANANPVVLDSNGEAFVYLLGPTKLLLTDSDDVQIWAPSQSFNGIGQNVTSYEPDYQEADQGADSGASNTVKYFVDTIGTDKSTILLRHNSGVSETPYTFATAETIPSNITLMLEPGAKLDIDSGATLTINGPFEAGLRQTFSGAGVVRFGAGSVSRVYPQWWGVLPDGTDDSTAAGLAKDAAVASGAALFFPPGTYTLSLSLDADDDNLTIEGADQKNTIIDAKDNATDTISLASGCNYVTIKNLSIANSGGTNDGTHYGIYSTNAAYAVLKDLTISGYNNNIHIEATNTLEITRVYSSGAVFAAGETGHGLYVSHATAGTGFFLTDSHFVGNDKTGVVLENLEQPNLDRVEALTNGEYGIHIDGANNSSFMVSNCSADTNTSGGILIEDMHQGSMSNVWVSSSSGTTIWGLYLKTVKNSTFTGISAYNCTGHGILLGTTSTGNTFSAISVVSNTLNGIYVDTGCYGNSFTGVTANGNAETGLTFADTTAQTPNYLMNGYLSGNTVAQITTQSKDLVIGTAGLHGITSQLTFYRANLADGTAAAQFYVSTGSGNTEYVTPQGGSVIAISVALNDSRSAGSLDVRPAVNGVSDDDLKLTIDDDPIQYNHTSVLKGIVPFVAGDRIGWNYDTDAAWATKGAGGSVDAVGNIWLIFN
uniref:Putative pectate lyase n=1 Tax=viral metagenome TaxID=1070528 RepID=A0A6M3IPE9_9ZZZZ